MTVEGYYDGTAYVTLEKVDIKPNQRVQITILDEEITHDEMQKFQKPRKTREEIAETVRSFMGRSHCWNGVDIDGYIKELREDREIVG